MIVSGKSGEREKKKKPLLVVVVGGVSANTVSIFFSFEEKKEERGRQRSVVVCLFSTRVCVIVLASLWRAHDVPETPTVKMATGKKKNVRALYVLFCSIFHGKKPMFDFHLLFLKDSTPHGGGPTPLLALVLFHGPRRANSCPLRSSFST